MSKAPLCLSINISVSFTLLVLLDYMKSLEFCVFEKHNTVQTRSFLLLYVENTLCCLKIPPDMFEGI